MSRPDPFSPLRELIKLKSKDIIIRKGVGRTIYYALK